MAFAGFWFISSHNPFIHIDVDGRIRWQIRKHYRVERPRGLPYICSRYFCCSHSLLESSIQRYTLWNLYQNSSIIPNNNDHDYLIRCYQRYFPELSRNAATTIRRLCDKNKHRRLEIQLEGQRHAAAGESEYNTYLVFLDVLYLPLWSKWKFLISVCRHTLTRRPKIAYCLAKYYDQFIWKYSNILCVGNLCVGNLSPRRHVFHSACSQTQGNHGKIPIASTEISPPILPLNSPSSLLPYCSALNHAAYECGQLVFSIWA